MRKAFLWLICLILLLGTIGAAYAEDVIIVDDGDDDDVVVVDDFGGFGAADAEPDGIQWGTKLIVGSLTEPSGIFSTEMFGNNTTDIDIRALLHGYDTVVLTKKQGLMVDETVVKHIQVGRTDSGETIYVMEFSDQLRYNDGTPITAKDYAFSVLLGGAPEISALGGTVQGRSHLEGYPEYAAGETNVIRGVRLVSDYQLVLYISQDYLPYFYGHAMVGMKPLPISVIAPGCEVRDDGEGIYIAASAGAENMNAQGLPYTPGVFSVEMLRETLLDEEHGYLSHPRRTSGPYSLVSYDDAENTVTFVVNEEYIGNSEGQKPYIETVVYRTVKPNTMISDLLEGRVDLLNKMTDATIYAQVMQAQTPDRQITRGSYLRTGLAFVAFACEEEPTSSDVIRHAIAMGIDKDALIAATVPGSALKVHGYYGLGQWMATYTDEGDEKAGTEPMDVSELLDELEIAYDVDAANALLDAEGWVYKETGDAYAGEGIRYRETETGLERFTLSLAITEDNQVAQSTAAFLQEALMELGIELEIDAMPFPHLLSHYYRQEARTYDLFFMASNFNYIFDPYYDFNTADEYQGMLNTTGLKDEELMQRALSLRQVPAAEMREYMEQWLLLQERFVEVLPIVPLYTNVYFDYYVDTLKNYDISMQASWASALLYAYMAEDAGEIIIP